MPAENFVPAENLFACCCSQDWAEARLRRGGPRKHAEPFPGCQRLHERLWRAHTVIVSKLLLPCCLVSHFCQPCCCANNCCGLHVSRSSTCIMPRVVTCNLSVCYLSGCLNQISAIAASTYISAALCMFSMQCNLPAHCKELQFSWHACMLDWRRTRADCLSRLRHVWLECSEVIDAMYQPSRYDNVYPFSYMYTYFVSVPHSILIQLANPTANKAYGELDPHAVLICWCAFVWPPPPSPPRAGQLLPANFLMACCVGIHTMQSGLVVLPFLFRVFDNAIVAGLCPPVMLNMCVCGCVCAGNVYGVVPVSASRDVSIVLMIIHQFVAYALYVTPVFFMWERLVGTHQKPLWIRLPSRLPVCKPSPLHSLALMLQWCHACFFHISHTHIGTVQRHQAYFCSGPCISFSKLPMQ